MDWHRIGGGIALSDEGLELLRSKANLPSLFAEWIYSNNKWEKVGQARFVTQCANGISIFGLSTILSSKSNIDVLELKSCAIKTFWDGKMECP